MMGHELHRTGSFWAFHLSIDKDLADSTRQQGCSCGGRLHRANCRRSRNTAMNFVSIELHKKTIAVCVVNEAASGRRWVPRVRSYERVPSGPRARVEDDPWHPSPNSFRCAFWTLTDRSLAQSGQVVTIETPASGDTPRSVSIRRPCRRPGRRSKPADARHGRALALPRGSDQDRLEQGNGYLRRLAHAAPVHTRLR